MIVKCPNCSSTFNLADNLVPEGGRKVKCSVCEHIFHVMPASEQAQDLGDDVAASATATQADGQLDNGSSLGDVDSSFDQESGEESLSFNLDEAPKKKKKKGSKKRLILLLVIFLLIVAGGFAGVYFFAPSLLGMGAKVEQAQQAKKPNKDQVKNIFLEGIRQYYVENDKAGRIFVIEGKAVNQFDKPKELVEVEANLYDANNKVLNTVRLMCGNTLSLFQLQVLSRQEIEKALTDEAGIGANNINLQPGQNVPFMVVFFKPPENVSEFRVSVVAAKDADLNK